MKDKYERCVLVLDFRRLTPQLLENWSETLEAHAGAERDVIFFCDGKAWRACRPGRGKSARKILGAIGESDINLTQKAYYNGHYGLHGLKVQQILQGDGMRLAFQDSVRRHDSVLLHHSGMLSMMPFLRIGTEGRNVKVGTDKACPCTDYTSPQCTQY